MSKYTAPRHTPSKRRLLSRSTKILSLAVFLLLISLFAVVRPPAKAAAANPIYATFQYVDNAISTALSPIKSAIASLQTQQANQATQISNLQNATGKQLRAYDANGTELGLLIDHGSPNTVNAGDTIYSTTLNRFIYLDQNHIANNFYGFTNETRALFQSSDCTGTPYDTDYAHNVNDLLPYSSTTYYIFHDSEQPNTINTSSQGVWDPSSNHLNCIPNVASNVQAYQLYPVSLLFPTPVAFPLQYKYQ